MDKYIYIVRHGTTDACENGKSSGESNDVSLNEKGVRQINNIKDKLLNTNIKYIYTSNFKRTIETSELINGILDNVCQIELDNRISNKDNLNEYRNNIKSFLNDLLNKNNLEGNICLVTHGKIIKLLYYYCLNNDFPDETPKINWCNYGCISCLKIRGNQLEPIYFGQSVDIH